MVVPFTEVEQVGERWVEGKKSPEPRFGKIKFELPIELQVEMSSRQLDT